MVHQYISCHKIPEICAHFSVRFWRRKIIFCFQSTWELFIVTESCAMSQHPWLSCFASHYTKCHEGNLLPLITICCHLSHNLLWKIDKYNGGFSIFQMGCQSLRGEQSIWLFFPMKTTWMHEMKNLWLWGGTHIHAPLGSVIEISK